MKHTILYPIMQDITPEQAIAELIESGATDVSVSRTTHGNTLLPTFEKWYIMLVQLLCDGRDDYHFSGDTLREATDKALEALQ